MVVEVQNKIYYNIRTIKIGGDTPMKVVNLFAGACSGKSTTAAGLFCKMKQNHLNAELVIEYAKDLIYSNREHMLSDYQEYIFAKQYHRLARLRGKVDFAIVDSPLLFSNVYLVDDFPAKEHFKKYVFGVFDTFDNINIFLERPDQFQQEGRVHNLAESRVVDQKILNMLNDNGIPYTTMKTNEKIVDEIFHSLINIH